MGARSRLRLERTDPAGRPAAMVATWVMGELRHEPGVSVQLEHPDVVTLETVSVEDMERIRALVAALLTEPRFARWAVAGN